MEKIGHPFSWITQDLFKDIDNAGWDAYQPVAGLITIILVLAWLAGYGIFYYGLKSSSFGKMRWWIGIGLLFAIGAGWFAYWRVMDLGDIQQKLNLKAGQITYDQIRSMALSVGIIAFLFCFLFYVGLSIIPAIRGRNHPDIPFTFRRKR